MYVLMYIKNSLEEDCPKISIEYRTKYVCLVMSVQVRRIYEENVIHRSLHRIRMMVKLKIVMTTDNWRCHGYLRYFLGENVSYFILIHI